MKQLISVFFLFSLAQTVLASVDSLDCVSPQKEIVVRIDRSSFNKANNTRIEIITNTSAPKVYTSSVVTPKLLLNSENSIVGKSTNSQNLDSGFSEAMFMRIERNIGILSFEGNVYMLACQAR